MDQALKIAKLAAFSALAFLCFALTFTVLDARVAINSAKADVHSVTAKVGNTLDGLKVATDSVSSQAVQTMITAGGTLKQAKQTIAKLNPALDKLPAVIDEAYSVEHDARLSLDNVNRAAIDERFYFERDLPPLMDAIKADVVDAGDTLTVGKTLLTDPNLNRILKDSADVTQTGSHMLSTADAVETKATKSYLHPSTNPVARVWQEIKPFLVPAAQVGAAIALH